MTTDTAPELSVSEWLNTDKPLTLAGLRGRPVRLRVAWQAANPARA
jgi:hypothetical protein